jgi:DNA-directed RNA polymerase specialized sigma24 family protein
MPISLFSSYAKRLTCDNGRLMNQIESGSSAAFEELYRRYSARGYRVARSVCCDNGRAEDAVREGFIAIWQSRAAYQRQRGTVAAWLLFVVRYRAIDIVRRNGSGNLRVARTCSSSSDVNSSFPSRPCRVAACSEDRSTAR